MKILTVRQPWAYAIFHFGKDIENRDYIQPLLAAQNATIAIHTSQRVAKSEYEAACEAIFDICRIWPPEYDDVPHGQIIGLIETGRWLSQSTSKWFFGKFGLPIQERTLFRKPVPAKGQLGLWTYQGEVRV